MKFLVVGGGSIGCRHVGNLLALGRGPVSVCETDPASLEKLKRDFYVEGFARLEEALAWGADAVLVCTPTHLHIPVALAAIEAGAHLFIEKPVAASLEGTADLLARVRAARRVVLVGCNMRFHPGVAHLKAALDTGALRRPLYFLARFSHYLPNWRPGQDYRRSYSARRDEGGGIILEGIHEIDYLRWLGGEITGLRAHAAHLSDLEIDSEDYASLTVRFESGAIGQVELDYLSPLKLRGCEVMGVNGSLRWWSEGKVPEQVWVLHRDGIGEAKELYACPAYDGNAMYLDEMRHFLDCIEGKSVPLLGLEEGCRVLEIALAAHDAAESGREAWSDVSPKHALGQ